MTIDIDQYARDLAVAMQFTWSDIADKVSAKNQRLDRKFARPDIMGLHGHAKTGRTERRFVEYKKGDQFYLRVIPSCFYIDDADSKHRLSSKLQHRYTGPHVVESAINPVTYRAIVNGKIKVVNASKMKRDQPAPAIEREIPDFHEDNEPVRAADPEHPDDGHVPPEHPADANPIEEYDDERDQSDDDRENESYFQKWREWAESADPRPHSSRVPPLDPVDPAADPAVSATVHSVPKKPWALVEQSIRAALAKQAEAGTTLPAKSPRRVSKFTDISIPKRPLRRRKHKQVWVAPTSLSTSL